MLKEEISKLEAAIDEGVEDDLDGHLLSLELREQELAVQIEGHMDMADLDAGRLP